MRNTIIFGFVCFYTSLPVLRDVDLSLSIKFFWDLTNSSLQGKESALLAWISITVVSSVALTVFLIINTVAAAHFALDAMHAWSIAYSFFIFVVFNSYVIYMTSVCYKAMCRQDSLHPIGKGISFIWEYFSNETKIAAMFFLTSEIVSKTSLKCVRTNARVHL